MIRPMFRRKKAPPVTYEIVNRRTSNTLAEFDSHDDAVRAFNDYVVADEAFKFDLMLLTFDTNGEVVEVEKEQERLASAPHFVG